MRKSSESRLARFSDCQSAIDHLFADALDRRGDTAFQEFLSFVVRFSNLSIYNAMLVMVQRPGAGAVATIEKWSSIGRYPKKRAVPIVVLRPFGPVTFLFEQADTEGLPLPNEDSNPLIAKGTLRSNDFDALVKSAAGYEIAIEETEQYGILLAGTAQGINIRPERVLISKDELEIGPDYRVVLNAKHDPPTKYATLAHELAHIYCGHCGADLRNARWPDRSFLSIENAELEAEAAAWLVCQRKQIETRSANYLSELVPRADLSKLSIYAIFEAANRIEARSPPAARSRPP
jgi:hypothetical protein